MINKDTIKNFNIIAINLDGLRRDKVFLCNSLKSLISKSFFFSQMDTVSPYTFASIHAIMTGTYPSTNGVNAYYNILKFKINEITTIAQVLKKNGYHTVCDINDEAILNKQGFDEYNIYDERIIDFTERHCDVIRKLSGKKFFLFLQNTEMHNNLVREIANDEKITDQDYFNSIKKNNERYESHLKNTDSYIKSILETLGKLGMMTKTILIVFSDHGTSIGEKFGEKFYGVFLYEYTLNAFCLIHIPKHTSGIIDKQCRTIDIFPTIVELSNLGKEYNHKKQGKSLIPLIENTDSEDREVFAETGGLYGPWPSPEKHNVFCIKNNKKKLIYNDTPNTWEFYDLKNDPKELDNIYDQNSKDVKILKERLLYYLKENNIITKISK